MPAEENMQTPAAQEHHQLVRQSVQYLQKYVTDTYGNVKSWSPAYVQTHLDSLESTVVGMESLNKLSDKAQHLSEPLITSLDQRLDVVMQSTQGLKTDLTTKAETLKTDLTTKAETLKTDLTTKAETLKTDLTTKAVELRTGLETRAESLKTDLASKALQWKSVRGDLSKKTIEKLEAGLVTVRQFSSEQSKALLHVDLIQYATEVLDNAQTSVKPHFDLLQERVAAGVLTVSSSVQSFQELALQKSREGLEQAEAWKQELRARLSRAIVAARELSHSSSELVLTRLRTYRTSLENTNLSALTTDSVQYILDSPTHFAKLATRLEQLGTDLTSLPAMDSINRLLSSLQEVIVKKPADSAKQEETKEESKEDAKVEPASE